MSVSSIAPPQPKFNPQSSRKPYMRPVNGRLIAVAWLDRATRTLHAQRRNSGFSHTPPGICFERSVLAEAERDGATHVEVTNTDTGAVYAARLSLFRERGMDYRRGHDQLCLPMRWWRRSDLGEIEQLNLFELEAER